MDLIYSLSISYGMQILPKISTSTDLVQNQIVLGISRLAVIIIQSANTFFCAANWFTKISILSLKKLLTVLFKAKAILVRNIKNRKEISR